MSVLSDFTRPSSRTFLFYFLFAASLIFPGFSFLFNFAPRLLERLDIIKLIFISISISLPIFLMFFLAAAVGHDSEKETRSHKQNAALLQASMYTLSVLFVQRYAAVSTNSLRQTINAVASYTLLLSLIVLIHSLYRRIWQKH